MPEEKMVLTQKGEVKYSEEKEIPFAVKYARVVNGFFIVLFIMLAVYFYKSGMVRLEEAAREAETAVSPSASMVMFLIATALGAIPSFVLALLNKLLGELDPRALTFQIIVSCLFLMVFPIGTVLYSICLYFFLAEEETRKAFNGD